jgi:urease accessory protein
MRPLLGNAILRYAPSKVNAGRLTVGLLILLLPAMARAHAGGADAGLAGALMHPVSGLDHLLAMICVGVVSVQLGGANVWRIPATFVCAMAAGTALGIAPWLLPHAELGIAASVLVLGLGIVIARRRLPSWPVIAMVIFFAPAMGMRMASRSRAPQVRCCSRWAS